MMLPKANTVKEVDEWFKQTITKLRQIYSNIGCMSKKHVGSRDYEFEIRILQISLKHSILTLEDLFRKAQVFDSKPEISFIGG
jgi:hypothetical protein